MRTYSVRKVRLDEKREKGSTTANARHDAGVKKHSFKEYTRWLRDTGLSSVKYDEWKNLPDYKRDDALPEWGE